MFTAWSKAKTTFYSSTTIYGAICPGWSSDIMNWLLPTYSWTVSLLFVFVSQDNRRNLLVQCFLHSVLHLTSLLVQRRLGLVLEPWPRWGRRGPWPRCRLLRSWPDGHGDAGDGVRRPCLVLVSSLCRQVLLAGATVHMRRRYGPSSSCSSSHGRTKSFSWGGSLQLSKNGTSHLVVSRYWGEKQKWDTAGLAGASCTDSTRNIGALTPRRQGRCVWPVASAAKAR